MSKYIVTYDYKIRGRYYPHSRIIHAESEQEACNALKARHLPGYDYRPFHVEAELAEEEKGESA